MPKNVLMKSISESIDNTSEVSKRRQESEDERTPVLNECLREYFVE